jgi:squalene synthase HpnC
VLDSTTHYENFPVGSWLVPRALRPAYAAVYRFARYADDVADEGDLSDEARLDELTRLQQALDGKLHHPMVDQLLPHVTRHQLGLACFQRLLAAFSQDIKVKTYRSLGELLDYCDRSANPVGELVLRLFASHDPSLTLSPLALSRSNQVCSALQIINFLQDIALDWRKGRVYLPQDLLLRHGLDPGRLKNILDRGLDNPASVGDEARQALCRATQELHQQAQTLLSDGRALLSMTPTRLSLELRAICAGGQRILDRLAAQKFDPLLGRPSLGWQDGPALLGLFLRSAV